MITVQNRNIPASGTLLESLEKAGVPIESQCRKGYCGACRATLTKGEVEYVTEPLGFTRKGEVLACCCKPKANFDIEVKLIA
ncbi:class I ribonucleotide reductase maintenance protein YfaE [Rheinheimera sp.]|uniref:class I ribonucleotide reductase maintenance protein YfaE n=1 Tax=Rheinheimera sp. TaxID=1869214 RepID=UPI004047232A